jgi:hypothetical protein
MRARTFLAPGSKDTTGVRLPSVHGKWCFFALVVAICLSLTAGPVEAVTWTLDNVLFTDGGTATGNYNYDAATNTFSSINIITSGGTGYGANYNASGPSSNSSLLAALPRPIMTGSLELYLILQAAMTDAGGIIGIDTRSMEGTCGNECGYLINPRLVESGQVTAVLSLPEVPLPSALPLFATGLGALGLLGWWRKRKQLAA